MPTIYAVKTEALPGDRPVLDDGSTVVRAFQNRIVAQRVTAFLSEVQLVRHADLTPAEQRQIEESPMRE